MPPQLSVNIDHVATLRRARYRDAAHPLSSGACAGEPDAALAFHEAELGGADGITVHLREDRRHINDRDVTLIRSLTRARFNLEIAATDEMIEIARSVRPHSAMLVPEGRNEVTTEGGLDAALLAARLAEVVRRLRDAGCMVSAFVNAEERQIDAAYKAGFDICEIHTGPYAHAFQRRGGDFFHADLRGELRKIEEACALVRKAGMRCNAGHALNYANVGPVAALPGVAELHIGHAIISRAIFVGLRRATREMQTAIARGTPGAPQ